MSRDIRRLAKSALKAAKLPAHGALMLARELVEAALNDILDVVATLNVRCVGPTPEFAGLAYAVRGERGVELHLMPVRGFEPLAMVVLSEGRAELQLGPFTLIVPDPWASQLWAAASGALTACEEKYGGRTAGAREPARPLPREAT